MYVRSLTYVNIKYMKRFESMDPCLRKTICFSFFTTLFFPPSQKIMIPKHMQKRNFFKETKTKLIIQLPSETISCKCVFFYENSSLVPVCTLKLQRIGVVKFYICL